MLQYKIIIIYFFSSPPPPYLPQATENIYKNSFKDRMTEAIKDFETKRSSEKKTNLDHLGAAGGMVFDDIPEKHDQWSTAGYVNGHVMLPPYDQNPENQYLQILPDRDSTPHHYQGLEQVVDSHPERTDNERNEDLSRAPGNIYQTVT